MTVGGQCFMKSACSLVDEIGDEWRPPDRESGRVSRWEDGRICPELTESTSEMGFFDFPPPELVFPQIPTSELHTHRAKSSASYQPYNGRQGTVVHVDCVAERPRHVQSHPSRWSILGLPRRSLGSKLTTKIFGADTYSCGVASGLSGE